MKTLRQVTNTVAAGLGVILIRNRYPGELVGRLSI